MLSLSIDRINAISPYKVFSNGEGSVVFITDHLVNYEISFVEDYTLNIDNSYQLCISNMDNTQQPRDVKVRDTVIAIIKEFFQNNELCMLYICDTSDGRQKSRHRIFSYWFEQAAQHDDFTFIPAHLCVDEIDYYASLILCNQHPEYQSIVEAFKSFDESLKDKWE